MKFLEFSLAHLTLVSQTPACRYTDAGGHFRLSSEDTMTQDRTEVTRGFSEPLYEITYQGKALAVVGANSEEHALLRAEVIRNHVPLPHHGLLRARHVTSGPICLPFFSGSYFAWLSSLDDLESGTCPICGR